MRIGLIADIHGNHVALQCVLDELALDAPDLILCAGDVAGLGPEPAACIRTLREMGIPTVRGNVDRWMVDGIDPDTSTPVADLTRWAIGQLTEDDATWLAAQPTTRVIDTPNGPLALVHSTPDDDTVTVAAATSEETLQGFFEALADGTVVGGHTHVQLQRQTARHVLVNPGSVGLPGIGPGTPDLPRHTQVTWAEYALLDLTEDRRSVAFRRIALPMQDVLDAAQRSAMPHLDWWLGLWGTE